MGSEAKTMTKKLVKVANDAKANGNKTNTVKQGAKSVANPVSKPVAKPVAPLVPKGGRRGRSGQQPTESSDKENKEDVTENENVEVDVPKKTVDSKRGRRGKRESPENEDLDKLSFELTQNIVPIQIPKEEKKELPRKGRGRGRGR